jgi:hypothetical protein
MIQFLALIVSRKMPVETLKKTFHYLRLLGVEKETKMDP